MVTAELLRAHHGDGQDDGDQDHVTETLLMTTRDMSSGETPPSENTEEVYEVSKCVSVEGDIGTSDRILFQSVMMTTGHSGLCEVPGRTGLRRVMTHDQQTPTVARS